MGICNGFAIPVAQSFGAKNDKTLRKYVANSTWLALLFAVIMTIATIILCKPILRLMRTPDDIFTGAYTYIVIIFAGIPATILYNMVSWYPPGHGRQQNAPVFSDPFRFSEYLPGSILHHSPAYGSGRAAVCNRGLPRRYQVSAACCI